MSAGANRRHLSSGICVTFKREGYCELFGAAVCGVVHVPWVDFVEWNSFLHSNVFTRVVALRDDSDTLGDRLGSDWVITSHHYHLTNHQSPQTSRCD